ncbi:MAG: MAPEG family protein [Gammaproteobacteria bacterium]
MTIPVWVLLGFAAWTVISVLASVGVYRWGGSFRARAALMDFPAEATPGSDWYARAMRAHANCIEDLPIYAAVVVAIIATGVHSHTLAVLALVLLVARVGQTITHIALQPSNVAVAVRFGLYAAQLVCMIWMGVGVAVFAYAH